MAEPAIDANFEIIYEDDVLAVVSKPGNCPVHEGGLYRNNCLTAMLEKKYGFRLFPVYRLDRETSGIVVFAKKNSDVARIKCEAKAYLAVCSGVIKKPVVISEPIGEKKGDFIRWKKCVSKSGKQAVTEVYPLQALNGCTLVKVIPKTGRQHQIRVHMQHIGNPILGDKIYAETDKKFKDYLEGTETKGITSRQQLHLAEISVNGKKFECPVPVDMLSLINKLKI